MTGSHQDIRVANSSAAAPFPNESTHSRGDNSPLSAKEASPLARTRAPFRLLNGAGDRGKYVVRARADKPDGAYHDNQDHSQHHCILGDILSFFFRR
jgi:hypothetical protein